MANVTFLDLQNRVKTRVIDLPSAVEAEVPALVKFAHRDLQRRHNFRVMRAVSGEHVTTEDTRVLAAIPSDFKEFRSKPYYVPDVGDPVPITPAVEEEEVLFAGFGEDEDGAPRFITQGLPDIDGVANFEVWPLPDGSSDHNDGEYRIFIPYYRFLPALSADADTDWLTDNGEDYIIMRATAEAFSIDWDEERMAIWKARADEEFLRVVAQDKHEQVAGVETLAIHTRGARQPRLRR